jgi:hypothetical protein
MNVERYKQVLAQIKADPVHWDQGQYSTAGGCRCFLGWASHFSGHDTETEMGGNHDHGVAYLELTHDEGSWIFSTVRTVADFEEFLSCGTIPPGWEFDGVWVREGLGRLTKAQALDRIHELLDGQEWSPETISEIADVLRRAGLEVHDVEDER